MPRHLNQGEEAPFYILFPGSELVEFHGNTMNMSHQTKTTGRRGQADDCHWLSPVETEDFPLPICHLLPYLGMGPRKKSSYYLWSSYCELGPVLGVLLGLTLNTAYPVTLGRGPEHLASRSNNSNLSESGQRIKQENQSEIVCGDSKCPFLTFSQQMSGGDN